MLSSLPGETQDINAWFGQERDHASFPRGSLSGRKADRGGWPFTAAQPGWFLVNTYDLKARPKWAMAALTLHESVPGHHLQYAIAQEMENLPEWRKWDVYLAFAEGWTRQQAIDYYLANTARNAREIENEVDRIIIQPGSVPAYKIGELKIRELRAYAEKALGPKFDLRVFHDRVLEHGQLPLDLLEKSIQDWVSGQLPPR
ncbi:MAG TPA: DUF885 family protein [Thermoanaerobaculia bacterium]